MMSSLRVYICGPMSGHPHNNFPAFEEAAKRLRAGDYIVISPHEIDSVLGYTSEVGPKWEDAISWDKLIIPTCDMVYVLPGWQQSRGARMELEVALAHGLTVISGRTQHDITDDVRTFLQCEGQGFHASPVPADAEVRVVDPVTGGAKGQKQAQLGALDPLALLEVAKVAGMGAEKYDRYNFLKGFKWSLAEDAGLRHDLLFWAGEDLDPESGLPHVAHAAWQQLCKLSFYLRGIGTDDRPPRLPT